MNPATINATSVRVTGPGGAIVTGNIAYSTSGSVVTFTPTANLAYSTQYTATITTAAADPAGDALASNYVWSFTTGAPPIIIQPTVISTIPLDAATGVPLNQALSANFSEAMNCATLATTGDHIYADRTRSNFCRGHRQLHRQRRYVYSGRRPGSQYVYIRPRLRPERPTLRGLHWRPTTHGGSGRCRPPPRPL